MKKIYLWALVLFFAIQISAQSTVTTEYGKYVPVYVGGAMTTNLPKQKTAPKGSVYLVDDWMHGTIILKDSTNISGYPYRYNMRSKYIELKDESDSIKVLSFAKVDWMFSKTIHGTNVYDNCSNYMLEYPELGDCEFVEIMVYGKATLFDKLSLNMIEANYNRAVDAGETSDTYYVEHTYYILKDGELIRIKKSKGSVLNVLEDKKEELSSYIKSNKLKMREPNNIAQVVKYYNSLYEGNTN